jgi:hypothetical protein
MPIYGRTTPDLDKFIAEVMAQYHDELADAGVTVGTLWAHASSEAQPALKLHGWPCHAIVKINPVKDRIRGLADATITIDKGSWDAHEEPWRRALIDHELQHLAVARDDEGAVKLEDHGRPKLKMRLHDRQIGTFDVIVQRHGDDSEDARAMKSVAEAVQQMLLPWG